MEEVELVALSGNMDQDGIVRARPTEIGAIENQFAGFVLVDRLEAVIPGHLERLHKGAVQPSDSACRYSGALPFRSHSLENGAMASSTAGRGMASPRQRQCRPSEQF